VMQEKRLRRWMKELLSRKGLNVENWYYIRCNQNQLVVVHKHSLQPRIINLRED